MVVEMTEGASPASWSGRYDGGRLCVCVCVCACAVDARCKRDGFASRRGDEGVGGLHLSGALEITTDATAT